MTGPGLDRTGPRVPIAGTIARQASRASTRGPVLDMVADRFVDFSAALGLDLVDPDDRGLLALLAWIFLALAAITCVQRAWGFHAETAPGEHRR